MSVTASVRPGLTGVPADVTSFVGRRHATADVKRALSTSRLVTLTGVGGTGKTRLARHVALGLERAFADGVCMVELDKLREPSLVGDAVATALGLSDPSKHDPEVAVADYLADRQLLLVLDNCEHLVDACASLVAGLLPVAPKLKLLATSREPLGINGEHVWPVPALSLPPEDSAPAVDWASRYEALALFADRAAAVVPGFVLDQDNIAAVARLCQRLDGLPLAIELAAARLRALTVEEILTHLQDRFKLLTTGNRAAPARQQTLRATVEWSYHHCSASERALWAKLSVFAGGFDLAAAEDVCTDQDTTAGDVFTGIAGLIDKSVLVKTDSTPGARYRMLETLRQYGHEQLSPAVELSVRHRHRDHYLRLAQRAEADWFGPHQVEWIKRLQVENPNVREALEFCFTEPGQARSGLALAGALSWYGIQRNMRGGRRWLARALACDTEPSPERTTALLADGWIAAAQGDSTHARSVLDEAATLARQFNDEQALGYALQFTALGKWFQGELSEAVEAHEQAVALYRKTGTVNSTTAVGLAEFGTMVATQGDTERAAALCQECIDTCRAHNERWTLSWGLWHLGFVRWLQHDLRQANAQAKESLGLKRALGDQFGISWCVEMLAWVAAAGDTQRAAVLFGITGTLWEQIGGALSGWRGAIDISNQRRARVRQALGQPAFDAALARGRSLTFDEAMAYAIHEQPTAREPTPANAPELPELTRREREVATLVAKGMSNKDIGATLVIGQRTAETHIQNILTKLGFTSRTQIAVWVGQQDDR